MILNIHRRFGHCLARLRLWPTQLETHHQPVFWLLIRRLAHLIFTALAPAKRPLPSPGGIAFAVTVCLGVVASTASAQERFLVDEGLPPMSAVIGYSVIGGNRAIAVDNDQGIFLIESDRRTKKIGQAGEGPCSISRISSFTVVEDTVFVLDNQLGRITGYSISTGQCTTEMGLPALTDVNSLGRVGGWFYLVQTKYTSVSPPDRELLYRLGSAETLEPLGLTVADLQADLLPTPVQFGRRISQIRVQDGVLHFLLPFSRRVWRYDTRTETVSFISLTNDSPDIPENLADPSAIAEIIPALETELDLFVQADRVGVLSNFEQQWWLGLYSLSGELLAKETSSHVDFSDGEQFYSLVETGSETDLYAIQVVPPPKP